MADNHLPHSFTPDALQYMQAANQNQVPGQTPGVPSYLAGPWNNMHAQYRFGNGLPGAQPTPAQQQAQHLAAMRNNPAMQHLAARTMQNLQHPHSVAGQQAQASAMFPGGATLTAPRSTLPYPNATAQQFGQMSQMPTNPPAPQTPSMMYNPNNNAGTSTGNNTNNGPGFTDPNLLRQLQNINRGINPNQINPLARPGANTQMPMHNPLATPATPMPANNDSPTPQALEELKRRAEQAYKTRNFTALAQVQESFIRFEQQWQESSRSIGKQLEQRMKIQEGLRPETVAQVKNMLQGRKDFGSQIDSFRRNLEQIQVALGGQVGINRMQPSPSLNPGPPQYPSGNPSHLAGNMGTGIPSSNNLMADPRMPMPGPSQPPQPQLRTPMQQQPSNDMNAAPKTEIVTQETFRATLASFQLPSDLQELGGQSIDLFKLLGAVQSAGGPQQMSLEKWRLVGTLLGFHQPDAPNKLAHVYGRLYQHIQKAREAKIRAQLPPSYKQIPWERIEQLMRSGNLQLNAQFQPGQNQPQPPAPVQAPAPTTPLPAPPAPAANPPAGVFQLAGFTWVPNFEAPDGPIIQKLRAHATTQYNEMLNKHAPLQNYPLTPQDRIAYQTLMTQMEPKANGFLRRIGLFMYWYGATPRLNEIWSAAAKIHRQVRNPNQITMNKSELFQAAQNLSGAISEFEQRVKEVRMWPQELRDMDGPVPSQPQLPNPSLSLAAQPMHPQQPFLPQPPPPRTVPSPAPPPVSTPTPARQIVPPRVRRGGITELTPGPIASSSPNVLPTPPAHSSPANQTTKSPKPKPNVPAKQTKVNKQRRASKPVNTPTPVPVEPATPQQQAVQQPVAPVVPPAQAPTPLSGFKRTLDEANMNIKAEEPVMKKVKMEVPEVKLSEPINPADYTTPEQVIALLERKGNEYSATIPSEPETSNGSIKELVNLISSTSNASAKQEFIMTEFEALDIFDFGLYEAAGVPTPAVPELEKHSTVSPESLGHDLMTKTPPSHAHAARLGAASLLSVTKTEESSKPAAPGPVETIADIIQSTTDLSDFLPLGEASYYQSTGWDYANPMPSDDPWLMTPA